MPAGAGPRIAMVKTTKKTPLSAARPPSWIHLIWTVGDTARRQVLRWRYQLTWGPEGAPRFQISDDLQADLGRGARVDDLYAALSTQAAAHLRGAAYDLRGSAPCVWELRPGPRPRYGARTKPRTLRATDEQVARWTAAAGDRPWSSWAVDQLDIVAQTRPVLRRHRRHAQG
jgi:hypothetical protein